ncbi:MAG: CBS domain-containing protein [Chloroflexi bacterium]|nr:CBS domain-containing protein [Chloroflexota bacterium]
MITALRAFCRSAMYCAPRCRTSRTFWNTEARLDQAFRLFLRKGSELKYKPIAPLVIRNPLVVDPEDHVAKAAALMLQKNIHRLPVVKDGRLLGTVGRADICQAVVGTL